MAPYHVSLCPCLAFPVPPPLPAQALSFSAYLTYILRKKDVLHIHCSIVSFPQVSAQHGRRGITTVNLKKTNSVKEIFTIAF